MYHCVGASHGQCNDTFSQSRSAHSCRAARALAIPRLFDLGAPPTGPAPRDAVQRGVRSSFAAGRVTTVKRGARRKSSGSRGGQRPARRWDGAAARPSGADGLVGDGWVEWGGKLIWAVGFTEGGAPYGLRVCDFDPADLEAMGLPSMAGSGIEGPAGWPPEPDAERGSDDTGPDAVQGHVR